MLRGTTEQAVRQTARSLAETRVPSGRLLYTMVDGLCGPHCLSPWIVVVRSRNGNKWPPFDWVARSLNFRSSPDRCGARSNPRTAR